MLRVPVGYSVDDLRQESDALSASLGKLIEIKDHRGGAVIIIHNSDFPDMIPASKEWINNDYPLDHVLIGFDRKKQPIFHDFRVPHLLIAGIAGYGKTDLIRWILWQLITRLTPAQLKIEIIDMKGFSFLPFRGIPHIDRIARDIPTALSVLKHATTLMKKRSNDVWTANNRAAAPLFQWHIVLIDEAAQLSPGQIRDKDLHQLAREADSYAAAISCVGREARVGLLYCTQRPDAYTINPQVKANMEASIGFRTKTQSNSEIIIDRPGLERLPAKKPGRAVYATHEDIFLQVPYVGKDPIWEEWLFPYKKEGVTHEGIDAKADEYNGDLD